MEIKEMNLFEKMLAITSEIKNVNKNLEVGIGKSSYKAVGEADVLKAVKDLEAKYGIYSYPSGRRIVDNAILNSKKTYDGKITETNQLYLRIETTYKFINVDNPIEEIEIITYGDGIDTQDKGPGKAMTYADKYALMKAYKIITGDDPDQNPSPESASYIEDINIEAKLGFGKYKDLSWIEVNVQNPKYIDWLISKAEEKGKENEANTYKKIKEEIASRYVTIEE